MKKIVINKVEYSIECNAYTRILYNSYFKSKIFEDLAKVQEYNVGLSKIAKEKPEEVELYSLKNMDDILDVICKLTYIVIRTANKDFMEFESWLYTIPNLDMNGDWVTTVIELITDCFRG